MGPGGLGVRAVSGHCTAHLWQETRGSGCTEEVLGKPRNSTARPGTDKIRTWGRWGGEAAFVGDRADRVFGRQDPCGLPAPCCSQHSSHHHGSEEGNSSLPQTAVTTVTDTRMPLFGMAPDLHVVQGTPATVRVPRAQALPTGRVLFTRFHGDPGDLAGRGKSTVRSRSDTSPMCVQTHL